MMIRNIFIAAVCLTLGACVSTGSDQSIAATICEDPRPQVCTMDYTPVCATLQDGSVKTYPNGCGACADANVKSWVADACPE